MHVYHEVDSSAIDTVLIEGLKLGERGEKSDDESVIKTDELLDEHCPDSLQKKGLSRSSNIYAYVSEGEDIVDIVDGEVLPLDDFVASSSGVVLKVTVDSERCYISDLDLYDQIKSLVEDDRANEAGSLVDDYWRSILPLTNFDIGDIERPEVMITYDIKAYDIEICR